ncbi:MAG: cytochrome P450 [Mycetocola sp.]
MTMTSPDRPVVEFDHQSKTYAQKPEEILDGIRATSPVTWTHAHDGFWIATTYDDVTRILTEYEEFSSEHDLPEDIAGFPSSGSGFKGVAIPEGPVVFIPSEADPPFSTAIRRLEAPHFTPKALKARRPLIEQHVDAALDEIVSTGRIEFAHDLAVPVPIKVSIPIVGVPFEEWQLFGSAEEMFFKDATDPEYPWPQIMAVQARIMQLIADRRAEPQDDVATSLTQGLVNGAPLTDQQIGTILNGLSFAGSHTVTAVVLEALLYLGDKPELRQKMLDDPALMSNGIEEFLRVTSPFQGSTRNVVNEIELGGQRLHRADRIYASMAAANTDPEHFESPHEIRLDRPNANEHVAFSTGMHRCLGAGLAKLEANIILTKVFQRLPDYTIEYDGVRHADRIGGLNTYTAVPARFTPTT